MRRVHATAAANANATVAATATATAASPSSSLTPPWQGLWSNVLHARSRPIRARSSDIQMLTTPDAFCQTLLDLSSRAHHRCILSALYIGSGPHEKRLVAALAERQRAVPDLTVDVLIDYWRGIRRTSKGESSATVLAPLLHAAAANPSVSSSSSGDDHRVRLSLFQVPSSQHSHPIERLFRGRWRELRGLHHMKFYVFDDTTIVSGANLSDTYFTNRQDRYVVIRNNRAIADHFAQLTATLRESPYTHRVCADGSVAPPPPSAADASDLRELEQALVALVDPSAGAKASSSSPSANDNDDGATTWCFPTIQFAALGIHQERDMMVALLQWLLEPSSSTSSSTSPLGDIRSLDLATGYMNLTREYMDLLARWGSSARAPPPLVRVLTGSREANGWWNASGIARHVPDLYDCVARDLLVRLERAHAERHVQLHEYRREGLSFHAKGLWLKAAAPSPATPDPHVLNVVGSTNFGVRGTFKDSETGLWMFTPPPPSSEHSNDSSNDNGNASWQRECEADLRATLDYSSPITLGEWHERFRRLHPLWLRVVLERLTPALRRFM